MVNMIIFSMLALFYLSGIPFRCNEVVDLQEEVLLDSLQPLNGDTCVRHPGNRGQVVLTDGETGRHHGS